MQINGGIERDRDLKFRCKVKFRCRYSINKRDKTKQKETPVANNRGTKHPLYSSTKLSESPRGPGTR